MLTRARLLGNDVSVSLFSCTTPCPDVSKDKQQQETLKQVPLIQTHLDQTQAHLHACF